MRLFLLAFTFILSFGVNAQVILDFETPETSTHFQYFGSSIDGSLNEIIANPNPTGVNTSDSVAVHVRPAGSETFAGAFSNPGPSMTITGTTGGQVCIDVHMDHIGSVGFKLENGDGAQNWTIFKENTVVNDWETLCFEFDSLSQDQTTIAATGNTYSTIVIFFDFGTVGDVDQTNYFDNIVVEPGSTVVDIVVGSEDHDTLEAAVIAADLAGALSGAGPFTLFAPTDAAFAALPEGTIEALLADPTGDLTDILLYHVIEGKVLSGDIAEGETVVPTLNGKDITITKSADGVFVNGAQVTVPDLEADNGVVHVINGVLLPPDDPVSSDIVILDFEAPETSTLFQYFGSSIDGTFNEVIANPNPTEVNMSDSVAVHVKPAGSEPWAGAFSNPDPATSIDGTSGGQVCIDVHMDHIGSLSLKLEGSTTGENWRLTVPNTVMNEWETLCFDLSAASEEGGMLPADGHEYSRVVLFFDFDTVWEMDVTNYFDNIVFKADEEVETTTIVDIVVGSEDHDTLEAAVIAADLAGTLSGAGPFTLFAPTDAAFAALPEGTIEALLADPMGDLTDILLYHVVDGTVLSGDIADGESIVPTLLPGKDITINKSADGVFVNGAQVTVPDLTADNGVVHVINGVLLPPADPETGGVIVDFEAPETSTRFQYFGSSLEPMLTEIIANPNPTGVNTSDSVGVYVKAANSQTWAGAFSNPNPTVEIDATAGGEVCVDVHMDHVGNLALKLENGDGAQNWISQVENTAVNEWETLCFDLDEIAFEDPMIAATGNVYKTVVLFFDFGANDVVDVTSYFDNIVYKAPVSSNVEDLPLVTFDLKLTPNRSNDIINVEWETTGRSNIQIFSTNGSLINSLNFMEFQNQMVLDVNNYQSGIYFLKLNTQQGSVSKKFTVTK